MTDNDRKELKEVIENLESQSDKLKTLAMESSKGESSGFEGVEERADLLMEVSNWISQHVVDLRDLLEAEWFLQSFSNFAFSGH